MAQRTFNMVTEMVRADRYKLFEVGIDAADLHIFYKRTFTEYGMHFGSYLICHENQWTLIGTVPDRFTDLWTDRIREITSGQEISWFILPEIENGVRAIHEMLKIHPSMPIVASHTTLFELKQTMSDVSAIEIRNERNLVLGGLKWKFKLISDIGKTSALYAICENAGALFTADAFGCNLSEKAVMMTELSQGEQRALWRKGSLLYLEDIQGRQRVSSLLQATKLLETEQIRTICPMKGVMIDPVPVAFSKMYQNLLQHMPEASDSAEELPRRKETQEKPVSIMYSGNYLYEQAAEEIRVGLLESGIPQVQLLNLTSVGQLELLDEVEKSQALVIGTNGPDGDLEKPMWDFITSLTKSRVARKPVSVYYKKNGSHDNVDALRARLSFLEMQLSLQDYIIGDDLDDDERKRLVDYGFGLGCSIQKIPNPRKPKLVKCLVCGEIFDASLGICPVCGVGLDQCVPVDEEDAGFRFDTNRRYLILGGGVAAVSAAEAIRDRDRTGAICILSREGCLPINRPMLTKNIDLLDDDTELLIHGRQWYEERRIELKTDFHAVKLDTGKQTVSSSGGEQYTYDKLILATGAECFVPPITGHEKKGVLTIRHVEDVENLSQMLTTAKHAVVIGGGVLGLEAASELMRSGITVTVIEVSPQICGRQIDAESAQILKKQMQRVGVTCVENVNIEAITGEEKVQGVKLADGTIYPADFVIVSCGNRGNTQITAGTDIAIGRSIVVNEYMETSVAHVFACGDCAEFQGMNYQLWQEASLQGKTAGANAVGDRVAYANQVYGLNLEGFGVHLYAIGDPGKNQEIPYRCLCVKDEIRSKTEKYWFYGESLEGAVLIGAPEKVASVTSAVAVHARYDELIGA